MINNFITDIDILDEAKDNFLTYSSEVLTDRAIPAAEDGLLSAQRKLLWTMEDYLKMNNKSKTKKCNAIVGSTLATSYFHGDQACYGVLCKMSQDYLMRYPLIEGQGSLGTQESNDMVASSRYTEAKPSKYADLMMNDFKKNVVPLKETYNGEFMEPVVLPAIFPNAIVNGRQAIGISMSHNSLPHNLSEVCDAIVAYIHKGAPLTIEEVLTYIKGPDFPLHNIIINSKDIKSAFETGHSTISLKVRGHYSITGRKIIFDTIPYRTYRNKIREQINKNVAELSEYIEDFDDESNLGKNRLVFTVKKDINPEKAVLKLFALTDLQTSLSYNMNYIVNGTPKLCSMMDLIKAYVDHQIDVLLAATKYDKLKAEQRAHIIEGLLIVIKNIDRAIELIKNAADKNEATDKLINEFNLDEKQAEAVLNMKLSSLTRLDKNSLLKELEQKKNIIENCNKIIFDKSYRDNILIEKILEMKKKYGDARRTELLNIELPKEEKEIETVIPEDVVVIISKTGDIKKIPKKSFRTQHRNGAGVKALDDVTLDTISTNTIDTLLVFTNMGKMYRLLVDKIPTGTNVSKGQRIGSLLQMKDDEKVSAITSLNREANPKYVIFTTKEGLIKKTELTEFLNGKRSTGIQAIKIRDNDELIGVSFVDNEDIVLITHNGMSIKFSTTDVNPTGRASSGVKGIKLSDGDYVIEDIIVKNKKYIAVFGENGCAKKTNITEYPKQTRGGKGVLTYKGKIEGAAALNDSDRVLLLGKTKSICIEADDIPTLSRLGMGNLMIKNDIATRVTVL